MERVQRHLSAILAADVVSYSRLMGGDETGTLSRLKAIRQEIVDPAIARHSGRIVKLMGDGLLIEFASAVDAVNCASEIQGSTRDFNADLPESKRIRFRIGINVGDIIVEDDDIYGDGVNVAARIERLADPGGVLISRTVADHVRDKISYRIEERGTQTVKNIARPVEIFNIRLDESEDEAQASVEPSPERRPDPDTDKPSIAVLAFNNMSGDAEQEYFSDGISEDIITDLSKLSELHVIARNSSFVYKGGAVPIPQMAQELGVRYVLEGSVRKAGNRVRVNAQLIDAKTGGHVWAERFDRDLTDIFTVQDELTREIVSALKIRLTRDEKNRIARDRGVDFEAYNLYLRARQQVWLHTRDGNLKARDLLARAIAIAPGYAAAHADIAFTHVIDYVNGWSEDPGQSLETALTLARHAVQLKRDEAQAHFALAVASLWNRDLDFALEEARHCLRLMPNSAEGLLATSHIQIFNGSPAEAIETLEGYMQLDPHYPDIALHFLAEAHVSLGHYDRAVEILQRRLERRPDSEIAHVLLASCYGHLDRIEESRAAWAEALRLEPSYSIERRRRILPYRNPTDFERRVDGLRKAGLVA